MNIPILRDDATRILLRRAITMWLLVRLVFLAVGRGAAVPHPTAVILLAAFLSVAEWRRRTEVAFWRNLGIDLTRMIVIALAAATVCELFLTISLSYVLPHR